MASAAAAESCPKCGPLPSGVALTAGTQLATSRSDFSAVEETLDELAWARGVWPAARDGKAERVAALLDGGVAVDAADGAGYRALHFAARGGHVALVELLLGRGADPTLTTRSGGCTALHRACLAAVPAAAQPRLVALLLDHGARPEQADSDGATCLHKAAAAGRLGAARAILGHRAAAAAPQLRALRDRRERTAADCCAAPGALRDSLSASAADEEALLQLEMRAQMCNHVSFLVGAAGGGGA